MYKHFGGEKAILPFVNLQVNDSFGGQNHAKLFIWEVLPSTPCRHVPIIAIIMTAIIIIIINSEEKSWEWSRYPMIANAAYLSKRIAFPPFNYPFPFAVAIVCMRICQCLLMGNMTIYHDLAKFSRRQINVYVCNTNSGTLGVISLGQSLFVLFQLKLTLLTHVSWQGEAK